MLDRCDDRITIQHVPPEVYPASYPAWFFNEDKFLSFFAKDYALVEQFDSFEAWDLGDVRSQSKGYVFAKHAPRPESRAISTQTARGLHRGSDQD
jgi:hypothetical protein